MIEGSNIHSNALEIPIAISLPSDIRMMTVNRVFLGGTCGNNHWREDIVIPGLIARGVPEERIFNPVVKHWDDAARMREDQEKAICSILLFVIASPDPFMRPMTANVSAYSLVELTMSLYDAPERTVAMFDTSGMDGHTAKAINKAVYDLRMRFPYAKIFSGGTEYSELNDHLAERLK